MVTTDPTALQDSKPLVESHPERDAKEPRKQVEARSLRSPTFDESAK